MVSLHNQIVASMVLKEPGKKGVRDPRYEGRTALRHMYEDVFRTVYLQEAEENAQKGSNRSTLAELDRGLLDTMNETFPDELGHYFRNLYRILKFVDESGLAEKDKRALTGILRAQLSNSELGLIFYNGKSALGEERFKPLLERYSMFQNMTPSMCINPVSARHYSVKAYGNAKDKFFDDLGLAEPDF